MLNDWNKLFPGRLETMFSALQRISPSHLLDLNLFDFETLTTLEGALARDDTAFDTPQFSGKVLQSPVYTLSSR